MKYTEIIERIDKLDKSKIIIRDYISKSFSQISLIYDGVRQFDLRRPQMDKLELLGYDVERIVN